MYFEPYSGNGHPAGDYGNPYDEPSIEVIEERENKVQELLNSDDGVYSVLERCKIDGGELVFDFGGNFPYGNYDPLCYYISLDDDDVLNDIAKEYTLCKDNGYREDADKIICLLDNYAKNCDSSFAQIAEDFKKGNVDKYFKVQTQTFTKDKTDTEKGKTDIDR